MIGSLLVAFLLFQSNGANAFNAEDPISNAFLQLIQKAGDILNTDVYSNPNNNNLYDVNFDLKQYLSKNIKSGELQHQTTGPHPEVQIKNGLIFGETVSGSHAFYSIPYGKAPVGPLRFMPPEPAEDFGELNASLPNYRMCWQIKDCDDDEPECRDPMTEDCLVLNVNVPASVNLLDATAPTKERLPVLVWFHGGFFFRGRSTTTKYDARWLSPAINAIVVTVNYRLGPLGFLTFQDELGFVEGNQGLKDQQLALKWVKDNIHAFGGDNSKVTLFSNSAGAQATIFHLISSYSFPFFNRAIVESAPAVFQYQNQQDSISYVTSKVLDYIGCSGNYTCLRTANAESITYSRNSVMIGLLASGDLFGAIEPFRPVIDGYELVDQPLNLFKKGLWHTEKEVIFGTNEGEMSFVSAFFKDLNLPLPQFLFSTLNKLVFGEEIGQSIISLYEEALDFDYSDNLAHELTDLFFVCPNRALARHASYTSTNPNKGVFLYNNAYPLSVENCRKIIDFYPVCGNVYHSAEQIFVFKSAEGYETNFTSEDSYMSDMFSAYWGGFAAAGNPNSFGNFSEWPAYESSSWNNIRLQYPSAMEQHDYRKNYCDGWDEIGYQSVFENFSLIK